MINLGIYSGKSAPEVRFSPTALDRILEVAALLAVLAVWGGVCWLSVRTEGRLSPDVWMTGGGALLCFLLVGMSAYLPVRHFNFPVRVDARNVAVQYLLAVRLVRVLNVWLCLTFFLALFREHYAFARIGLLLSLLLLVPVLLVYYLLAFRYK